MAARFRFGRGSLAPLMIQLNTTTSADMMAKITEVSADGENSVGAASAPVLTRPSVPGTGPGASRGVGLSPQHEESRCRVRTTFTTAPSVPSVVSGSFNLPRHFRRIYPEDNPFWVLPNSYALLYATALSGHSWAGSLVWEEL